VHIIWNKEVCILPAKSVQPSVSLSIQDNRVSALLFSVKWLESLKVGVLRPFKVQWLLQPSPALVIHEFYLLPTQCVYVIHGSQKKSGIFPYTKLTGFFFRLFRKIAKSNKYLCHVCPSEWNTFAPTGRIFITFYIRVFFWKSAEMIQILLTTGKNKEYFTWKHSTFMTSSRWILLVRRNASDKPYTENQYTNFTFNILAPEF
jgi:hypothetical protein